MFCLGKEVTNRELTVRLSIRWLSRVCAKARFFPDRLNECAADQGQIGEPAPGNCTSKCLSSLALSRSCLFPTLGYTLLQPFAFWRRGRHFLRGHTCNRQSARKGLNERNWTRFWRPVS